MLKRLNISPKTLYYSLLVVLGFWLLSLKQRQAGGIDDLNVFYKAGERLMQHQDIYGPPHFYNLKYFYSVLFASFMALFQGFGIDVVKWIWFVLNTALLMRVLLILQQHVFKQDNKQALYLLILAFLMVKVIMANFTYNQITIWMLWLMLEAFVLFQKQRYMLGIVLLCLGINIKLLPMVMVPYLLWSYPNSLKHLLFGCVLLLLLYILPALWLGFDYNLFLFKSWWQTLNPVSDVHTLQTYEYGLMDLSAAISKFLSAEQVYLEPDLHIANLSTNALFVLVNGIRIGLLCMAVHIGVRCKQSMFGVPHQLMVFAAFMALIPLCFPHQREYSYLLLMPMLSIQLKCLFESRQKALLLCFVGLIIASGVWVWKDVFGEAALNWVNHHRVLTYASIGLFMTYYAMLLASDKTSKGAE